MLQVQILSPVLLAFESVKTCSVCKLEKSEDAFAWRNKAANKRQAKCRACHRRYTQQHYIDNADLYKARAQAGKPAARRACKDLVLEHLLSHPCVDCGEDDVEVLEFDHIEAVGMKAPRVSSYVSRAGLRRLQEEIDKCEVRCANCHVRRTRRQFGWQRMAR